MNDPIAPGRVERENHLILVVMGKLFMQHHFGPDLPEFYVYRGDIEYFAGVSYAKLFYFPQYKNDPVIFRDT
nr:hypothetical protein [Chitinophaga sp.]